MMQVAWNDVFEIYEADEGALVEKKKCAWGFGIAPVNCSYYGRPKWWEQFLDLELNPRSWQNKFYLINKETGEVVGTPDALDEANYLAEQYLNKLFENIVLA